MSNNFSKFTIEGDTTFKTTDTSGVHVPHVNLDTKISGEDTTNKVMKVEGQFDYEAVATSQTAQVLGATGATGDLIHRLVISTITENTAAVTLLDDSTSIVIQTGDTNLQAGVYSIEINAKSVNGAWKITTGAGATVLAIGRFT